MTDTTANLSLPVIAAAQAQKHVTHNEALRVLDTLVQLAVLDRDLSVPPGSPNDGERWIVGPSPTAAWAGHADEIAAWQDGAWQFSVPRAGWVAFVIDDGTLLVWNGTAWGDFFSTVTSIQNLTLLGVGTTADATNPLSAKLNKALWVAKTAAEGGDGDLRYTMSKESAADVLSLLMQTNFSGRAEIGLTGDDDLTVKVSADGSAWNSALVADRASGTIKVPNGIRGLLMPETARVISAMTTEPRRARTFLIDDLIAALLDAGVWAKLDALYVFAAQSQQAALLNWRDPLGTAATAVNSPTFAADQGFTGDGSTSYIDSGRAFSGLTNYQKDSACAFSWSLSDIAEDASILGASGDLALRLRPRSAAGIFQTRLNDLSASGIAVANSLGLWTISRTVSTDYDRYQNATSLSAATATSTAIPAGNFISLRNFNTYSTRQIAGVGLGGYLTGTEVTALHAALSTYLSGVGAI